MHESWNADIAYQLDKLFIEHDGTASLGSTSKRVHEQLTRFGFALLRCTETMDTDTARSWLLALGNAVGTVTPQSPRLEMVEDVKDFSDIDERDERGYRSRGEFAPHSDPTTLIALHCVQAAKSGGDSSIVSVQAIVEKMQRDYPDLAKALFEPMPYWRVEGSRGVKQAGPAPDRRPVLADGKSGVSCMLYRPFIEQAAEALGEPLSAKAVEALDCFEALSIDEALSLKFQLAPGECMFLHNRRVLHARTDYEDWPERENRRHLLRIWLDAPNEFPAAPIHEIGPLFGPSAN